MKLFVLRHAHALDLSPDSARPLSDQGREQARRLGEVLKARGDFTAGEFWHSSLLRARETAEVVAEVIGGVTLKEVDGLRPEDDPRPMAATVAAAKKDLALFGHEPYLGIFGGFLMAGEMGPPLLFRKACGYYFTPKPHSARWKAVASIEFDRG